MNTTIETIIPIKINRKPAVASCPVEVWNLMLFLTVLKITS